MKNISLKLQDQVFKEAERLLEFLNISRNSYINEAVAFYNRYQKRKLIEEQLLKESEIVAEDSMEVLKEFEALEDEM
ncbi:MAG: hypothetical protein KDD06_06250 [Phaeodactylibacter sp.]|nr:hypothetical protein [Phaeodactylibacter sp.]MCB9263794.1 hypothetical protein [Lewinellaceae bacterium]MCB9288285.1 hypothetical protein [Lewinellaceae bacterium]